MVYYSAWDNFWYGVNKWIKLFLSMAVLLCTALFLLWLMKHNHAYIYGNDIYGHIYKSEVLYDSIKNGRLYPLFDAHWYSGITLFTYWPPLSYYFYSFLMAICGGDIYKTYFLFAFLSWFIGGCGWLLFGYREDSFGLCTLLGIFHMLYPDNCKVFFTEGNVPRIFITMLLPYLFFFIMEFLYHHNKKAVIGIDIISMLIVFTHFMTAAMVGVSVFFLVFIHFFMFREYKWELLLLVNMVSAYLAMGIVLIPGLTGGIVTQNSSASQETSGAMWSRKVTESLNPALFLRFPIGFYFGLFVFIVLIIGLIVFHEKTVPLFGSVLVIYIGTSMMVLPILSALPLSQVFWMTRFIPMAYVMFSIGFLYWDQLKRWVRCILLLLLSIDCCLSFVEWQPDSEFFKTEAYLEDTYMLDEAMDLTDSRIAFMDMSNIGSYASYIIIRDGRQVDSLFGWAYQGAYTIEEIVQLNEAFQQGYYTFVFDRLVRYGCDTVVIKKDEILHDYDRVLQSARDFGYNIIGETENGILLDFEVEGKYGTDFNFENVCIGTGAEYISFLYPSFYKLREDSLDKYTFDELKGYKKIYITGPNYKDKDYCEDLVRKLSEAGVHVYIDMSALPNDRSAGRNSFLGTVAQPIVFTDKFPVVEMDNGGQFLLYLDDGTEWRTVYLTNLHKVLKSARYSDERYLDYLGNGINDNITFIGLNLVYYQASSPYGDSDLYHFLDGLFNVGRDEVPPIMVRPVNMNVDGDHIHLAVNHDNVMFPVSNLDCFESDKYLGKETFMMVNIGEYDIYTRYPHLKMSLIVSILGIVLSFIFGYITIYRFGRYIPVHYDCEWEKDVAKVKEQWDDIPTIKDWTESG